MLIVALVLAVIGLAALVTAVVTSNELIAWVCIGASVIGVVLLIVDALRERSRGDDEVPESESESETAEDYPEYEESTQHESTQHEPELTPHTHEQAVDPAHGDVPPAASRD